MSSFLYTAIEHGPPALLTILPLALSRGNPPLCDIFHENDIGRVLINTLRQLALDSSTRQGPHGLAGFYISEVDRLQLLIDGAVFPTATPLTPATLQILRIAYLFNSLHGTAFPHQFHSTSRIVQDQVHRGAGGRILLCIHYVAWQPLPLVRLILSHSREIVVTFNSSHERDLALICYPPLDSQINPNNRYGLILHPIYGRDAQNALIPHHLSNESPSFPLNVTEPEPETEIELDYSGLTSFIEEFELFCDEVLADEEFSFEFSLSEESDIMHDVGDEDSSFIMVEGLAKDTDTEHFCVEEVF